MSRMNMPRQEARILLQEAVANRSITNEMLNTVIEDVSLAGLADQEIASVVAQRGPIDLTTSKRRFPAIKRVNEIIGEMPMRNNYIPPMPNGIPDLDDPTNRDSVPAYLTEGEFVLNKEASQMYAPQIEAMNNHGLSQRHQGNQAYLNGGNVPPMIPASMSQMGQIPSQTDQRLNELSSLRQAGVSEITTQDEYGQKKTVKFSDKPIPPMPSSGNSQRPVGLNNGGIASGYYLPHQIPNYNTGGGVRIAKTEQDVKEYAHRGYDVPELKEKKSTLESAASLASMFLNNGGMVPPMPVQHRNWGGAILGALGNAFIDNDRETQQERSARLAAEYAASQEPITPVEIPNTEFVPQAQQGQQVQGGFGYNPMQAVPTMDNSLPIPNSDESLLQGSSQSVDEAQRRQESQLNMTDMAYNTKGSMANMGIPEMGVDYGQVGDGSDDLYASMDEGSLLQIASQGNQRAIEELENRSNRGNLNSPTAFAEPEVMSTYTTPEGEYGEGYVPPMATPIEDVHYSENPTVQGDDLLFAQPVPQGQPFVVGPNTAPENVKGSMANLAIPEIEAAPYKTWTDPKTGTVFGVDENNRLFYTDRSEGIKYRVGKDANSRFVAEALAGSGAQETYINDLTVQAQTEFDTDGVVSDSTAQLLEDAKMTQLNIEATNAGSSKVEDDKNKRDYATAKATGIDVGSYKDFVAKKQALEEQNSITADDSAGVWKPETDFTYNEDETVDDSLENIEFGSEFGGTNDEEADDTFIYDANTITQETGEDGTTKTNYGGRQFNTTKDALSTKAFVDETGSAWNPADETYVGKEWIYDKDGNKVKKLTMGASTASQDIITTGNAEGGDGKKLLSDVKSSFKDAFKSLVGPDFSQAMMKALILYAGYRLTGGSGNNALAFAAKTVLADGAAYNKAKQDKVVKYQDLITDNPNMFDRDSVAEFYKTDDASVLVQNQGYSPYRGSTNSIIRDGDVVINKNTGEVIPEGSYYETQPDAEGKTSFKPVVKIGNTPFIPANTSGLELDQSKIAKTYVVDGKTVIVNSYKDAGLKGATSDDKEYLIATVDGKKIHMSDLQSAYGAGLMTLADYKAEMKDAKSDKADIITQTYTASTKIAAANTRKFDNASVKQTTKNGKVVNAAWVPSLTPEEAQTDLFNFMISEGYSPTDTQQLNAFAGINNGAYDDYLKWQKQNKGVSVDSYLPFLKERMTKTYGTKLGAAASKLLPAGTTIDEKARTSELFDTIVSQANSISALEKNKGVPRQELRTRVLQAFTTDWKGLTKAQQDKYNTRATELGDGSNGFTLFIKEFN